MMSQAHYRLFLRHPELHGHLQCINKRHHETQAGRRLRIVLQRSNQGCHQNLPGKNSGSRSFYLMAQRQYILRKVLMEP